MSSIAIDGPPVAVTMNCTDGYACLYLTNETKINIDKQRFTKIHKDSQQHKQTRLDRQRTFQWKIVQPLILISKVRLNFIFISHKPNTVYELVLYLIIQSALHSISPHTLQIYITFGSFTTTLSLIASPPLSRD